MTDAPSPLIVSVSDGRAANRAQAGGLALALAGIAGCETVHATVGNRGRIAAAFDAFRPRGYGDVPTIATARLVVGAGRVGNLAAHWAGRRRAVAVAVLRPPLPGLRYDAVVVPAHDGYRDPAALTTLGAMNALDDAAISEAAATLPPTPSPLAVLMIGGPSGSARFDAEAVLAAAAEARAAGYHVFASVSRRTPNGLAARLRALGDGITVWDGCGVNPYPGLLGRAHVVLVTSDSVSMLSEALFTGTPVVAVGGPQPDPRLGALLAALAPRLSPSLGALRRPEPLREARRVAHALAARGLLAQAGFRPAGGEPI